MAGTNVGNLNVRLTLSAEQFAAAMQTAGGQVSVFARGVTASAEQTAVASAQTSRFAGVMTRLNPIMNQASFGAADFASQLSTRGLGGALQAASNNIQVMGAGFGPWGLAISAAAGLATQAIGSYIEWQSRAEKKTKEATKKTVDDWKSAAESIREILRGLRAESAEFTAGLASDAAGGFGGASSQELKSSLERLNREESVTTAKREQALKEFDEAFRKSQGDFFAGEGATSAFGLSAPGATLTGASALDSVRRLHDAGFEIPAALIKEAERLDRQLHELDNSLQQNSQEYKARTEALKKTERAERDAAVFEEQEAERAKEEQRRKDERKRFDSDLLTPLGAVEKERQRIEQGFAEGVIDESERGRLLRNLEVQRRDAMRQEIEDRRRGRNVDAVNVPKNTDGIEKNTAKTAQETAKVARSVDRLARATESQTFTVATF